MAGSSNRICGKSVPRLVQAPQFRWKVSAKASAGPTQSQWKVSAKACAGPTQSQYKVSAKASAGLTVSVESQCQG